MKNLTKIIRSFIFISLAFFSLLTGCVNQNEALKRVDLDENTIAVFSEDYELFFPLSEDKSIGRFTPSNQEVYQAIEILQDSLKDENQIKDLNMYKSQFFGYLNKKGEKILWVNYFCDGNAYHTDWKTDVVFVFDGGNCYFNVKLNLRTGEVFDLRVNGSA